MCFYISPSTPDVLVATGDIKCVKILRKTRFGTQSPYIGEKYHTFWRKKCVKKKAKFGHKQFGGINAIEEGLHSYMSVEDVGSMASCDGVYNAIIPKGSLYYMNQQDGEYVSNKLHVFDMIKR